MLHVDLLGLVARKCQIAPVQDPLVLEPAKVGFVKEVGLAMLLTEEEPVAARSTIEGPLFQEGAKRCNPRAGSHHDDVACSILGETKMTRLLHVNRDVSHMQ